MSLLGFQASNRSVWGNLLEDVVQIGLRPNLKDYFDPKQLFTCVCGVIGESTAVLVILVSFAPLF